MTIKDIRFYVTGAGGMIGSNTARGLLNSGASVIGIDNLWRGTKKNIEDLFAYENFEFRHADIISDTDWYVDMCERDVLIHIADIVAGIGYVFAKEWSVFQKNLLINTHVAHVVNRKKPKQLIYLGTVCSYPQQLQRSVDKSVLKESDKFPADPESGYGWSKLIGEIEFRLATKDIKTQLTVLDLHNVYGWPCTYRDATAQVIPSLIYKAITSKDKKLSVWGDGKQGRAFVHVSDVVAAIKAALDYNGNATTFMVGPTRCTTIAEVAQIIIKHPRIDVKEITYDTSKPTGDVGRFADATLVKNELGWSPSVELEQGVHEMIDRILDDWK